MKTHQYESVVIVNAALEDPQIDESLDRVQEAITNNGGEIQDIDKWGRKRLAYPIQKKSTGFYHLIEFKNNGELIRDFEVAFKRDERILRFLTVKLDKHAVAYNEKKRKKAKEKVVEKESK